ncbi:hypothetical protein [Varibaculum cambriense]|uniref:hypothetical protein n=1 Tax=Varibaculum cambriense TaxID=184870 RepID=UPI0028FE326A|nr:hypothetical protein [Varibaculum cambriense]MDU1224253.1 hypothetical protein [Varibaculum cambriense]
MKNDPQDGKQDNPQENSELPFLGGGNYPVAYPPYPPTSPSAPVPAPGPGEGGDYPYPGGYPPAPPAYPGAYLGPGVNQAAPVPPSYPGKPGFPPPSNPVANPPYSSGFPAPYSANGQFSPVPPQRKKPRKHAVIVMLVALVVVLVAALTLGGIWVYRQHSTSALKNGIVPTVTKTVVVIKKVEIPSDVASDAPENPLWYPLRIDDHYTLVIWYKFTNQQLEGLSYQAVSSENGKKVAIADTGITLPVKEGENLPKCSDSQRYQIKDKTLQCATVKKVKKDSFSIPLTGEESSGKESSSNAKDSTYSVSGETLGTVGNVRVVAYPSAMQTNTLFGLDADNNLLWTKTLKEPGRSVLSGETLSVFNWNEDGEVTNSIYIGAKNADKADSNSAGATTKKDAIKNFDFANTDWLLPSTYGAPECEEDFQDQQGGCDELTNYRLENGIYRLNEKQTKQLLAAQDGNDADYGVEDVFSLQAKSIDSTPADYAIEYGDVNGDGYLDAIIPVISMTPFNNGKDVASTNYVWLMNPITGVPEQLETPVYSAGRCGEYYDHAEFSTDGSNPQLVVHTLTWSDVPCCGCGRDLPKKRSTWHYDSKRHDMVCDQDSGDQLGG